MSPVLGVLTVHGMGSFSPAQPRSATKPSYSQDLYRGVRKAVGAKTFDGKVVWREIYYSDLFDPNQTAFLQRIAPLVDVDWFRRLVVENLGDPASYRREGPKAKNQVYDAVHDRVHTALTALRGELVANSPIVLLAHSLGGHVASNYIWDLQHPPGNPVMPMPPAPSDIAAIVTFGCNIPVFRLPMRMTISKRLAMQVTGSRPITGLPHGGATISTRTTRWVFRLRR